MPFRTAARRCLALELSLGDVVFVSEDQPSLLPGLPPDPPEPKPFSVLVPDHYDDGGISGTTLDRPGLQRLLADIEAHRVDLVVVYKIDRLSRALMDFAKLVEVFDRNNVVSVTQSSQHHHVHGMPNAQHPALLGAVRARGDWRTHPQQVRRLRRKGMWMGGFVPLGYEVKDRKLVINEAEAEKVLMIFEGFARVG
jgi:hypothetical protein